MRPRRLTFSAFGSYAETLTIDFARLAQHGVFAITGPTGSGKSTIFDAVVYALYDDLPGFRVDGNVRSQYSDPSTPTRVTLEFEAAGEEWRVERCPSQPVPRRRGQGDAVDRPSTVVLERVGADGGGITRKQEVAARIEELVGLDKQQFEQVVLIPQGRFEEVLKADTKDRSTLLKQLFPVEIFEQTTERLRMAAGERETAFRAAERASESVIQQIRHAAGAVAAALPDDIEHGLSPAWIECLGADDLAAAAVEVARLRGLVEVRAAGAKAARDTAQAARDAARQLAGRWDTWQANRTAADGFADEEAADRAEQTAIDRARKVAALVPSLEQWRAAVIQLDRTEPALAAARRALADRGLADDQLVLLDDPSSAAQLAQRLASESAELAVAADHFDRLAAQQQALAADDVKHQGRWASQREQRVVVDVLEAELVAARAEHAAVAAVVGGLEATRQRVADLGTSLEACRSRATATVELARRTAALAAAVEAEGQARRRAVDTFGSWSEGSAGRLAQGLADGLPCPTCGSPEHPRPARLSEDAPTDAMLAAADAAADAAVAARLAAAADHARADAAFSALPVTPDAVVLEAELVTARRECRALEQAAERCAKLTEEVSRRTDHLDAANRALSDLERTLAVETAGLGERRRRWQRDRQDYVDAHGAFESMSDRAATLSELAGRVTACIECGRSVERATADRDRAADALEASVREFGLVSPAELGALVRRPREIAAAEVALAARDERRRQVRRELAAFEASGLPGDRPVLAPLERDLEEAEERYAASVRVEGIVGQQATVLEEAPAALAGVAARITAARRVFEESNALADLCAGRGSGAVASRLSLENWVLMDYLQRVLVQANARLAVMTDGRYSLELLKGSTDGRKQFGLDLAVFDVNTGQSRPATTLSGGETFMAALALALGLADVVAGGSSRTMGALFVDEGFGSLDADSLESVIEVLRSLEEGGRLVGVISHVEELKAALPNGISLRPSTGGSVATLNYPDR